MSGRGNAVFSAVKVSGTNLRSSVPLNWAVSRSAWAWTSGSSGMGGRSAVLGLLANGREDSVEGGEHRLRLDELLLVAGEADQAFDERLLGVELAGGDG